MLSRRLALALSLIALFALPYAFVAAQAQSEGVLVIDGATLIDGNGGAPVPDSVVVIRGNRISAVARRGQASYPPNAHVINFPGYPKDWERFAAEGRQLFTDPDLLTYYPSSAVESVLNRYVRIDQGAVRERRMKGYENALRFHKMFIDARGKIAISGNTNSTKAPGLDLHHEVQVMKDAGLTPCSARGEIQVTLDAEALRAVGKFDMVVRNPDPIDPAVQKGMWGNGTSNVAHLIVNYRY